MKKLIKILFILYIGFQATSCKKNRLRVDLSGIEPRFELIRFDRLLFDEADSFNLLHEKYPRFCDLFTYKIINIGGIGDDQFRINLNKFLSDTMILHIRNLVEEQYKNTDQLEKSFKKALSYYCFHFPDKKIPDVYTYISGFNQSIAIDDGIIGIGLDKYLGRNCQYYQLLGIPGYKIMKMFKERLPVEAMYAWAMSEFEIRGEESNLLSQMIYEGKLMYFVDAMFPDLSDSVKFGYTQKQLDWCRTNEVRIWTTLIENKMLYSTKRMDIIRYTGDAPTTSGFPSESPGRTGSWIGWQIVRKYMNKNATVTLRQLMDNNESQKILNMSGYYPY